MTVGVAYFGSRILRHVAADLADVAGRGFTGVLHTLSENDLAHYREQMTRLVAASHDVGLSVQVSPWGVGHVFGGEADSRWVATHPQRCQAFDDGTPVGAACPCDPAFRAFLRAWADAAVATGADRVFWDEPAWASPGLAGSGADRWACACPRCAAEFARRTGCAMPRELTAGVAAFRRSVLTELVQEMVAHVAAQGVGSTVCLLPPGADGPGAVGPGSHDPGAVDWAAVAATPGVEALATTPYWGVFARPAAPFVGTAASRLAEVAHAHGIAAQLWLQGFGFGPEGLADFRDAARAGRAAGVDEMWVWGYEAGGHMSSLGTREPEAVWEAVCREMTGRPAAGGSDGVS